MTTAGATDTTLPLHTHPYSVKRHGRNITNCDSEPVQTPGCVQAHGALLVLRLSDLRILQVSDNVQAVLGHAVDTLLGQTAEMVIGQEGADQLRTLLGRQSTVQNPLYFLTLPAASTGFCSAQHGVLDVTAQTMDGVVILEFELAGEAGAVSPDYFALVKNTVARLQTTDSLLQLCDLAAKEIRDLTGMDRVMVYKFHEDGHGEVFAESKRTDLAPWLGLHYPAEDVPKPARDVFSKTWLRPIPDMAGALAELVPLLNPDTGKPLDMTHCFLRGVSMMCTEYYQNMGVSATLTMSIRRGDHLWGLVSCIYYAGSKHLSYQVRAACEFLAQVVSLQHNAAEEKEHLAYRLKLEDLHQQLLATASRGGGLATLVECTPSLLDGIDAGGAALYEDGRWYCVGKTPTVAQLRGLGEWLINVKLPSSPHPLYSASSLARDYLPAAAFAKEASGLLAEPLSHKGGELMLWFKPETMQTVNWAGAPDDKPTVMGPNGPRLTPRASFALFVESVRERSLPWKQVELEAVARFRLQLAETTVECAGQRPSLSAELARSNEELDAFAYVASYDLKEPLRGIHRYAFQLMEEAALSNDKNRHKLDRMLRLTLRMDSLLDSLLHFSRVGKANLLLETVDLNEILNEALEMVGRPGRAQLEVVVPRALPPVRGNRGWCREILVNLLSNASTYSDATPKRVEVGAILPGEVHSRPGCPQGSEQHTIYHVTDNGIGIEEKHFAQIFKLFKRLHTGDKYGSGPGTGLTVVRKLVERHRGKVWLDSSPGEGTSFYFTLPCGGNR